MRSAKIYRKEYFVAGGLALLIGSLLLPRSPLFGQQQPKIAAEVKVVNVLATVRDKHGMLVPNLGKDDFELDEDGRPQTITYFSKDTDLPLTLGLLVDTSGSQRRVLDDERSASRSFLDDMLHADKDKAFVIHFDREVELLQDVTSSRPKLESALQMLDASPDYQPSGSSGGGGRSRYNGAGTLLYDAIYLASNEVLEKQQGRKALIILSDGVDRGSKETLATAIETVQRADTVVYSILFAGDEGSQNRSPVGFGFPGQGRHGGGGGGGQRRYPQEDHADGKKVLERISTETGGHLFEVSKKEPIDKIYSAIADELRNQYSIGYSPASADDPGYHTIHLTTKQKDLVVQARDGYYTDK